MKIAQNLTGHFEVFFVLLPLGLPGGNQVDGLPPASSNTKCSCLESPGRTDLFIIFRRFFEKKQKKITKSGDEDISKIQHPR